MSLTRKIEKARYKQARRAAGHRESTPMLVTPIDSSTTPSRRTSVRALGRRAVRSASSAGVGRTNLTTPPRHTSQAAARYGPASSAHESLGETTEESLTSQPFHVCTPSRWLHLESAVDETFIEAADRLEEDLAASAGRGKSGGSESLPRAT
jgi:hypothetical protein